MERKRLIMKMVLAAIVVFIIASSSRIVEFALDMSVNQRLIRSKNEQIVNLTQNYQKYLGDIAAQINQLPVEQHLISQITSEVLKKSPITKLYLWMNNAEGKFMFGVPFAVFERLNKTYDKYNSVIEADGYYIDRTDFLFKLVHKHEDISFSQFESGVLKKDSEVHRRLMKGNLPESLRWRFYKEHTSLDDYISPVRLDLSTPVLDNDQKMIGTLYLKVDDYTVITEAKSLRQRNFFNTVFFPMFEVIFGLSLGFLWFLIPSWVYIDARQRDVKNAFRWALLTVVSLGFAWLIYLIVRPTALKSFHCPQCQNELNGTKAYCPHCGFDLSNVFCPECQYPVKPEWQFCPSCRTDLSKKSEEEGENPEEQSK